MLTADLNRSQPPHRLPTARRTRAAFTLIELMVVIGIIMLLVGISVYAYNEVVTSAINFPLGAAASTLIFIGAIIIATIFIRGFGTQTAS